ncbi:MAG TPA: lipid II flippase MurJ, partial [Terriglobales bacterium]|nr:lipid II flippase MurJ [Terriglobales bacterium]
TSALAPLCTSLATIGVVLAARGDIRALAMSMVLGSLLEWVVVQWQLRHAGVSLWPGRMFGSGELRRLAKGSAVLLGGTFIMSFSPMIEQGLGSGLGKGTVAALGYANKLPTVLNTILMGAVGVTVLPFFSEMLTRRDHARCRRAFRLYALTLLVGGGLLVLSLVALSEPLVALAYQRGAFHADDTRLVAEIQRAYLIQLPGTLVGILAMRLLVAQSAYRVVAIINSISVVTAGMFAWTLSRQFGAMGIALGLSLAATSSGLIWFLVALRTFSLNHRIEEQG